jgi:MYXO-CTERM domain-containing protein
MNSRLLAVVVVLAGFGTAHAYELLRVNNDPCARNDQNLYWARAGVAVAVGALPPHYQPIAVDAWERWNAVAARFRFREGNGAPCTSDGVAAMALADQPCGSGAFGDAVAITRSIWNGNGTLVDADVTFNSNPSNMGVLTDDEVFRQVAMHELGHVLGLAHSDACGQSGAGTLMRAVLVVPPVLDAPTSDDVTGANFIYPGSGSGGSGSGSGGDGTVPNGANSCAVVPPSRGNGLPWPALGIGLLLLSRRRRRGN